jgi:hypothetical protein
MGRPLRNSIYNNRNPSDIRNVPKNDVAPDPTRATRSGAKRLSFLYGRFRNRKVRNQQQIQYPPSVRSVMKQHEMRSTVRVNRRHHLRIRRIQNSTSKRSRLPLQLERVTALRTVIIDSPGVKWSGFQPRGIAIHAIKIRSSPSFSCNSRTLRCTVIPLKIFYWKRRIHPRIRSRFSREINLGLGFHDKHDLRRSIISVSTRVIFSCIGHDWGSPRKTASDPDR